MNKANADPRILIVDDEPEMCEFLAMVVEPAGGAATQVMTAKAYRQQDPNTFAVLILDLSIPSLNGISVLRELGAAKCPAQVIIISGLRRSDTGGQRQSRT